jgi:hypothetical protein
MRPTNTLLMPTYYHSGEVTDPLLGMVRAHALHRDNWLQGRVR